LESRLGTGRNAAFSPNPFPHKLFMGCIALSSFTHPAPQRSPAVRRETLLPRKGRR
jgi:hypothetical protein